MNSRSAFFILLVTVLVLSTGCLFSRGDTPTLTHKTTLDSQEQVTVSDDNGQNIGNIIAEESLDDNINDVFGDSPGISPPAIPQ